MPPFLSTSRENMVKLYHVQCSNESLPLDQTTEAEDAESYLYLKYRWEQKKKSQIYAIKYNNNSVLTDKEISNEEDAQ